MRAPKVLLVTYHAIEGSPSPVCATTAQLEADLTTLAEAGFSFVSLDDLAGWLDGTHAAGPQSVAITFDDAYASVVSRGLPILRRLGVPSTVYVIAGRIGGDNRWTRQWKSIPSMPLADVGQLRELVAAGVTIGSHSLSHPVLSELDSHHLRIEVNESGDRLEQLLKVPVRHFAYPYGLRSAREVSAVAERYRTAVNSRPGLVTAQSDPHDLCRIDCHDLRLPARLKWLSSRTLGPYLVARRSLRWTRRYAERFLGQA